MRRLVARSRDESEPYWSNAVPVSLEAGGGLPCRPNLSATAKAWTYNAKTIGPNAEARRILRRVGGSGVAMWCCAARIPVASARARDHLSRAVPRHADGLATHGRVVPLAADQQAPANHVTTDTRRTRDPSSRADRKKYAMPSSSKVWTPKVPPCIVVQIFLSLSSLLVHCDQRWTVWM